MINWGIDWTWFFKLKTISFQKNWKSYLFIFISLTFLASSTDFPLFRGFLDFSFFKKWEKNHLIIIIILIFLFLWRPVLVIFRNFQFFFFRFFLVRFLRFFFIFLIVNIKEALKIDLLIFWPRPLLYALYRGHILVHSIILLNRKQFEYEFYKY